MIDTTRLFLKFRIDFYFPPFFPFYGLPSGGPRSRSDSHRRTTMPPIVLHSREGSADPQALKAVVAVVVVVVVGKGNIKELAAPRARVLGRERDAAQRHREVPR